jgi:heme/copper-type cytochrome/quinol oxidase subunit 4
VSAAAAQSERNATRAFAALVALSAASFVLVDTAATARLAVSVALAIAALKVRLVVVHFMELTWRARGMRLAIELWIASVTALLLGGVWLAAR